MASRSDTIFLIGSGFTKAIFPQAPLNANLLKAMIEDGSGPILEKYQKKYGISDIEELLTRLDIEAFGCGTKKQDRAAINAEISFYFSKFRFSRLQVVKLPWLEKFAIEVLRVDDTIVTLNYDCALEGGLDNYEVWTPNGGYARIEHHLADSIPRNPKDILVYKIHGSEHFVESRIANNRAQTVIGFVIDPIVFPKSGAYSHLGGGALDPRPYVIAPSFVKIPHVDIAAMMLELIDKAKDAKNLIIIGCGMRSEDSYLWLLLTQFLNTTLRHRKELVIIDPSSAKTWQRISDYWVGDIRKFTNVTLIPDGIESCVDSLPAIIGSIQKGRVHI